MENTEQNAVKILPFESISQVANKSINYIKARKNHSIVSLKTRWDKFNKATGGIEPNMIFTIAGISSSGNSAFYFKYFKYYLTLIMWNTLNNLGCTPRKSLTLKFPNITIFSNYWLIYSFIRGYFDGDGTISYCNNTHNKMQIKALGTSEFLSEMQKQLPLEYDNILYQREGSKVYELSFNAKRGAYVSSILYNGAEIYLERKYLRYKEFCRLYKGLYRELSSKYGKDRKVNSVVNS